MISVTNIALQISEIQELITKDLISSISNILKYVL